MVLRRDKRLRWSRRRTAANSLRLSTSSSMASRWANRSSSDEDDPKLPDDVAVEILKRLPAKSLLRFRSVCRSWRSAIDDPRFVALHLSHSALDASNWYLVSVDWCDRLCSLFSEGPLALPPLSQIAIPFVTPPDCCMIVGSCDGLICVAEISGHGFGRTMYLWNLFTRKHKAVRPSGPEHQFSFMETPHEALGFGFDARSNDYKIVRILYVLDDDGRCFGGMEPRVEIYSLGAHSWRSLACEVPALCQDDPAAFLNGNLHWFASKFGDLGEEEGGYGSIVLFDVAGEVFDEMALPPEEISDADSDALVMSLAVLNNLLAVFISFIKAAVDPELHSVCSVWVMREYGVPQSWTKLYTFKACGVVAGFDGFTKNGELLMELDGGERVSWNPITSQFTNLPLLTEYDLVTVVESLISP
ncbi:F-box/kelch-repeat protein At3g06240-like [Syzygium oleosum]|uniref:F-box/kelch-repeat protein At3g06240-like n=1 Tax=Syzygium oleosum TaxID=219896 RepID=UPI0011D2BE50|nr:F-box/kelch-repeat protein At3g06240-like [Syzygium oleosum]